MTNAPWQPGHNDQVVLPGCGADELAMKQQHFDRDQVAIVFLEALELGLPVTETIRVVMDCSTNQARHMVRAIRVEGFLGIPPHHPAKATVHRGSLAEKAWIVCEECTTAWPCRSAFPYRTDKSRDETPTRPTRPARRRRRTAERRPGTEH